MRRTVNHLTHCSSCCTYPQALACVKSRATIPMRHGRGLRGAKGPSRLGNQRVSTRSKGSKTVFFAVFAVHLLLPARWHRRSLSGVGVKPYRKDFLWFDLAGGFLPPDRSLLRPTRAEVPVFGPNRTSLRSTKSSADGRRPDAVATRTARGILTRSGLERVASCGLVH